MVKKTPSNKGSGTAKKLWLALAVVIVVLGLGTMVAQQSSLVEGSIPNVATFAAKEGPLWITVVESGTIRARNQVVLKSEVEGRSQVLWLVPEAQEVKKGDLLVRLDSSFWEDQRLEREIWDQQTEAGLVYALENLKVNKSRTESEINTAELAVQFATEDLKKYIEGDFPNELKEKKRQVALAQSSRAAAEDDLEGKEILFTKKFATPVELDTARRLMQRASLEVELAEGREKLLSSFTYKRRVNQLQSDLEEAKRALERSRLEAAADIVQAEAQLAKMEHWTRFGTKHTKKIETQIKNCEIYAPVDGSVLYATRQPKGGRHMKMGLEPLEEGQTVYEHQELIHLRTDTSVMAEISVGESDLGKVKAGQRVRITVDALPGKEFTGHITSIAIMPDAQSSWMGSGPNVYATEIFIDGDGSALRPGMSCQAEIVVEHHEMAVSVPVEAVLRVKGTPTVYVAKGRDIEERPVEIGLANETMIRIVSNLAAGERVLLAPPLERASVVHSDIIESVQGENGDDPRDGIGTPN